MLFDKTYSFIYVSVSMTGFAIPNFKINIVDEGLKGRCKQGFL